MSLLENLMDQAFAKLTPDERMALLQGTVEKALATLTPRRAAATARPGGGPFHGRVERRAAGGAGA